MPGQHSMSILQPVGVAGVITPWNSPAYLSIRSVAPALAAGCSVVLKMPGQAAHTARVMADIFSSVETLPAGQVNIFVESGSAGARYMVAAREVATVSFTGSTATGAAILAAAAAQIKRVGAELGGKTPHLIFADADLGVVLDSVVQSVTVFAGQFCMTGSRVLVHEEIADAFIDRLADRLAGVRLGPAADPDSEMGPMIDTVQVTRVDRLVEDAIAAGARVIVRGGPPSDQRLEGGAFYAPTLLEVPSSDLPIVQEEIFGPVQTVQRFPTEEEAIGLANDTDYGLSASVWTRDIDRATRVSRQVQAGLISINSWANLAVEFEEGGWKASGLGRLGGLASLEDFTEHKQITQNFA
jgi:betaine-aldehyde dehydrogenase